MKKFRFSLDKIRHLRQARLDAEQSLLRGLLAEKAAVLRRRAELEEEESRVMDLLRLKQVVEVAELTAIDGFRRFAGLERGRLHQAAASLEDRIERQRSALLEARKHVEALDHLRERRLEAWRREVDRETETALSELVIARWRDGSEPA